MKIFYKESVLKREDTGLVLFLQILPLSIPRASKKKKEKKKERNEKEKRNLSLPFEFTNNSQILLDKLGTSLLSPFACWVSEERRFLSQ